MTTAKTPKCKHCPSHSSACPDCWYALAKTLKKPKTKPKKKVWDGPDVGMNEVVDDKELLTLIRNMLEPAFEVMTIRVAMVAKQFALQALEKEKINADSNSSNNNK